MRGFLGILFVTVGVAACQPVPETEVLTTTRQQAVRCGAVIDGVADEAADAKVIIITGERISDVLPGDTPVPPGARFVDLGAYTCLPGLIDTHTHIALVPEDSSDLTVYYTRPMSETIALTEHNAEITLNAGFTTIRNVGDYFPEAILEVRERIRSGELDGPRIQTAGSYLTIPGGGGDLVIPGHDESEIPAGVRIGVARGADDFRAKTQTVIDNGADFVKIIASGAVFAYGGLPGEPEMTPEEISAVVEVAHAAGLKVTAHAHGAQSIKDAIRAGVDSIEHASLGDDEAVALAAERGVAFSMDVYNGTYTAEVGREAGYPEEFMRKNEETTEAQRVVFEKAYRAGVPILYGTDAGVSPHGFNARQFAVMVRRGMSPMDAIKSATSVAAEHMDMAIDVGAIKPGRYADLVAVRGNPLNDITLLQDIDVVIKGGTIVRQPVPGQAKIADTVFHTGKVYTVDPDQPWAQAVAIRRDRILFVGSDDGVRVHIGPETKVVDLRGRLMLPGFQDVHVHPIYGALEATSCYLGDQDGVAGYRSVIADYAAANPGKDWITGGGWSMAAFGPGGSPSKSILDELVPDKPVYLTSADGHTGWANSKALAMAGIDNDTPDPPDGIIDRDPETGEIVGSLQEGAMTLMQKIVPDPTLDERLAALEYARDMLHGYGITSIQEAYAFENDLETYAKLDASSELNLRVIAALWWAREETEEQIPGLKDLRDRYDRGNIRPTTVKIMQDGVMENYTAVMLEPYLTEDGTRGIPMVEPEFLKDAVSLLDAEGFQVHFHAIGDGAIRQSLDAVEEARLRNGDLGHRHHISHLQVIDPDDIPRFAELGVVANFQPLWAMADDYVVDLTVPFIGEERAKWMYPIRSVIDAGGRVAFGSDWSVSTANPFPQIETALTRIDAETHDTDALNPEQRISLEEAIAAFTINAAYVNHQDQLTGSIEAGKLADLIVLDRNLFEIEHDAISEASVLLTLFGGKAVHGDPQDL